MVESWLKNNEWQNLSFQDQTWLCEQLNGPDLLDKNAFSVRWTGKLRVPATGTYRFSNYQGPGAEGVMKLRLNNQVVFDSSQKSVTDKEVENRPGILLAAGEAIDFRLDYFWESVAPIPGTFKIPGYPAAVLFWESEVLEKQAVPKTAFTVSGGLDSTKQQGLRGEYFAGTASTNPVATRLDPAIDFLWDTGPIHTASREMQREILGVNLSRIITPGFLGTLQSGEAQMFAQEQLPTILPLMTASERIATVRSLGEQPELLKNLSLQQMIGAVRWLSLEPDQNVSVELLARWSKTTPSPELKPGFFPGHKEDSYLYRNIEPYFQMSQFFTSREENGDKTDRLLPYLTNTDGSCDLTIARVLACACRSSGNKVILANKFTDVLKNEELTGDLRANWLIGQAFKIEALFGQDFQPGIGFLLLDEALEVAESPEMRFQVVEELAVRLISLDRADEARSLIMSVRDQYPEETKQVLMEDWLEQGELLKSHYETFRAKKSAETGEWISVEYANEMKRRAAAAERVGDQALADRYNQTVNGLESVLAEHEKNADE